ncbi:hydrogenase maturation protease [uncultured Paludibaculum sp.]|uniref:hydrogenase maturation protease n=1 Tax=uncultured Paludibaculum sp. TaxID=1765020 RepID=UPI002AAABFFF|nr:hydrogenase maturation protease [uncultured Paludibaculum sp.]
MPGGKAKKYRALLLCCGHMDRGDDGIGPLCASALQERKIPARTLQGETSELLEAWQQAEAVIVVDAITSGEVPPGTLIRIDSADAAFQPEAARCSTHGLGLAQAVKLGRVLKCLPETLILMGLEAASFEWASTLSPPVAAGMPLLLDAIELEWKRLTIIAPRARHQQA